MIKLPGLRVNTWNCERFVKSGEVSFSNTKASANLNRQTPVFYVLKYFCFGLFGFSGIVMISFPSSTSG